MGDLNDRMIADLIDAVRQVLRKEASERLRDVYLIGDIEKDTARAAIERLRELANENTRPITLYINSAGGNVTDGLALHDAIRHIVSRGIEVTIIVQGMAYSMGSIVLQAATEGRRLAFPHSWIMIHEPAKWAGWQSTTAAAQHLERLKQMQDQIYNILSSRSGKPLRQIIKDTKRTDFYLDAQKALEYGLIDAIVAGELPEPKPSQFPVLIFGAVLCVIVGLAAFFLVRGMVRKQAGSWRDSMQQKVHARQVGESTAPEPAQAQTTPAQPQPKVVAPTPAPARPPAAAPNPAIAAGAAQPAVLMGTNGFPVLKVQGIFFRAKNPAAVINTKTVFIGDQVANAKVVAITPDSVTVEFNGNRKVLTLY